MYNRTQVMATVDRIDYIDRSGNWHTPPECVIEVKEMVVNSNKVDSSTGDLLPSRLNHPVCVTHGNRPVVPQIRRDRVHATI